MADQARVPTTSAKEGWTNETLLDHVLALMSEKDKRDEQRFEASEKAVAAAFAALNASTNSQLVAMDRAVTKAEVATDKRFESVNEFRGTLDNQQRTLIPRSEVAVLVEGLNEKISNVTKQLDEMKTRRREHESEQQGVRGGWGYAVGVVGLVVTLLAIVSFAVR